MPTRYEQRLRGVLTILARELVQAISEKCAACSDWGISIDEQYTTVTLTANGDVYERPVAWLFAGDYSDLPAGIENSFTDALQRLGWTNIQAELDRRIAEV